MTLNFATYYALPRLNTYAEALKRYEDTAPIRGCDRKLRPIGRRNQKWFNINYNPVTKQVGIGYGELWREETRGDKKFVQQPLIVYNPDGTVSINSQTYYYSYYSNRKPVSASCRERIARITGLNTRRESHTDWVRCAYYLEGVRHIGDVPLYPQDQNQNQNQAGTQPHTPTFILNGDATSHTYVNPVPAISHTINRAKKKVVSDMFLPFTKYVAGIAKLTDGELPRATREDFLELEWATEIAQNKYVNAPQLLPTYIRPSSDGKQIGVHHRTKLFEMVTSGDAEQFHLAMSWVGTVHNRYWFGRDNTKAQIADWQNTWRRLVIRHYGDTFLEKTKVYGKIVRDKYTSILSSH